MGFNCLVENANYCHFTKYAGNGGCIFEMDCTMHFDRLDSCLDILTALTIFVSL